MGGVAWAQLRGALHSSWGLWSGMLPPVTGLGGTYSQVSQCTPWAYTDLLPHIVFGISVSWFLQALLPKGKLIKEVRGINYSPCHCS